MKLSLFKNKSDNDKDKNSLILIISLLIHAAKIDQNYSEKEREIIKKTILEMGSKKYKVDEILNSAELAEKNSNQILEFTKEAKNLEYEKKVLLLEALWKIIYSDKDADIYETNLMRRLSGLLYLDNKLVGDIKEKIKNKLK